MIEALITSNTFVPTSLGDAPPPHMVLDGVWIGSLENGLPGETVLIYTVTFIVLVVLVIALAALIKYEIGREGGEGEGGKNASLPSSPPS